MNLSAVTVTPGGPSQAAAATWHVTSPISRGFQTVFYLRFDTHGAPDGIRIDEAACQLEGTFHAFDYNALNAAPIPAATLSASADNKAVVIKLDGPRQVVSVTLNPPRVVELHRADGLVQADKAAQSSGFTDVNFAIQSPAPNVTVNQVTAVNVRSQPGNPRLGIAAVDLKSPVMFWPTPESAGQLQAHAGAVFAKALDAYLSAQWDQARKLHQQNPATPLPNHIEVALVAQSDSPCLLTISQFHVVCHWLLASFPSGAEKQVLRFAGKRVERQAVSIQLPANAVVASATIRANESFSGRRPSVAHAGGDLLGAAAQVSGDRGLRISAGGVQRGGQRVTPAAAMSAAGIALGVMALSPGTQLGIELQTDRNGLPSGKSVAELAIELEQTGQQQWTVGTLKKPVTLPGAPFWVVLSATKGSAIWLCENSGDGVRILENVSGTMSETARLDGRAAMVRVLPPAPAAAVAENQADATPPAQANLSVGAASPAGTLQADGSRLFNVTSEVNAFLASVRARSPQATVATVPFVFTAGSAGLITVYSPEISYDA